MEQLDEAWVEELRQLKKEHLHFLPLQRQLIDAEREYLEVLEALEPEQQQIIKKFVKINQKVEMWLVDQAYLNGVRIGEKHANKKNQGMHTSTFPKK